MNHILALPPVRYVPYIPSHPVDGGDPSASTILGNFIGLGVVIVIIIVGYYLTRPDSDQKRKSHSANAKRKGQRQQPRKGTSSKKRTLTRQR